MPIDRCSSVGCHNDRFVFRSSMAALGGGSVKYPATQVVQICQLNVLSRCTIVFPCVAEVSSMGGEMSSFLIGGTPPHARAIRSSHFLTNR